MNLLRWFPVVLAMLLPIRANAQSLLERSPILSGGWTGAPGTIHFNFVHRFTIGNAPENKVTNVPTFLVAAGLPKRLLAGLSYSSNSTLAPRVPNEWELFARWLAISEDFGAPLDVGAQAGYNNAAEGIDAELSLAKKIGALRLIAAGRALSNPFDSRDRRFAVAGGAIARLGQFVALAADVGTLTDRDSTERTAWSAGMHFAIPLTPHTMSLHATNAMINTLQGASRGSSSVRYGFEFTIPLTLRRYFGGRAQQISETDSSPDRVVTHLPADTPPFTTDASHAPAKVQKTSIRNTSYVQRRLQISVGTTVEWTNTDPMPHSVTAVEGTFNSGLINPGKTYRHTFTKAGTFNFFCMPHPFMKGTIVVKERE